MGNKCKTDDCLKKPIPGKKHCMRCLKINAEVQQIELFPQMLKSLHRIETALANSSIQTTQEQAKAIDNKVKKAFGDTSTFIPSIEIPEAEVKGTQENSSTVSNKNLGDIAKKLKDMEE